MAMIRTVWMTIMAEKRKRSVGIRNQVASRAHSIQKDYEGRTHEADRFQLASQNVR